MLPQSSVLVTERLNILVEMDVIQGADGIYCSPQSERKRLEMALSL
ncbi:hypothetical protein JCM10914A_14230 [Paenibacillus sp. JCM 10914]